MWGGGYYLGYDPGYGHRVSDAVTADKIETIEAMDSTGMSDVYTGAAMD